MGRIEWLVVFFVGLGAMAWAGEAAKKEPPKDSIPLPATNSYYFLDVPQGVDPNEPCPLVVVAQNAPDKAKETFDSWAPKLKGEHVLVACLNLPADAVDQMEFRVPRMIEDIRKKYENLDTRHMVLVGAGAGAQEVMKFVAGRPGFFAKAAAISPNAFPDLPKRYVSSGRTELLLTLPKPPAKGKEPPPRTEKRDLKAEREAAAKEREANKKTALCIQTLRMRSRLTGKEAEGFGVGGVSDKEKDLVIDIVESCLPEARRVALAEARKQANSGKEDKEDTKGKETPKTAKTTEPAEKVEPGKAAAKETAAETKSPDELLELANKLEQDQKYSAALKAYERLAKAKPGSDYERLGLKKVEELKKNPLIRQALADEAAGSEPKRWLMTARNFEGAKQPDRAVAECKKITSKYPGTSYADEATKILERLEANK